MLQFLLQELWQKPRLRDLKPIHQNKQAKKRIARYLALWLGWVCCVLWGHAFGTESTQINVQYSVTSVPPINPMDCYNSNGGHIVDCTPFYQYMDNFNRPMIMFYYHSTNTSTRMCSMPSGHELYGPGAIYTNTLDPSYVARSADFTTGNPYGIYNSNNNFLASTITTCMRVGSEYDGLGTEQVPMIIAAVPPVLMLDDSTIISPPLTPDSPIEVSCDVGDTYGECYEKIRVAYNDSSCNSGGAGSCGISTMSVEDSLSATLEAGKGYTLPAGYKLNQTISFSPGTTGVYDNSIVLSASGGGSGNAVVLEATTPSVCTLTGNDLDFINVGTCTVTANQEGNDQYYAASQVTANITVTNTTPTTSGDSISTDEDINKTGTLTASDGDGHSLVYSIVTNGSKGTATITNTSTGAFTYEPNLNVNGSDSFTFEVNDGLEDSSPATISVNINAVNDAPTLTGVADVNVIYGVANQTINLDDAFDDVDNLDSELTYTFMNNTDDSVVIPSLNSNSLSLDFQSAGSSTVTLKAADPEGLEVETSFNASILKANTSIEITQIFPTPSAPNQEVAFSFTVTPASGTGITGDVTISDGTNECIKTLTSSHDGESVCRMIFTELGQYNFSTNYAGDRNYNPSSAKQIISHQVRTPRIVYTTRPREDYTISENGVSDIYYVELSTYPSYPVTLTITPDEQLSINEAGAGQPVTITLLDTEKAEIAILPIDDNILEGYHDGSVTHIASSADPNYDGKTTEIAFPIIDNEAGVVITQTDDITQLLEGGQTDNYSMVLSVEPVEQIKINIITDTTQVSAYPTSLTFTRANWGEPQNVRLSAVDDQNVEGEHTTRVTHEVVTQDTLYGVENLTITVDGESSDGLNISIVDNDLPQPPLAATQLTVILNTINQVVLNWQDNSIDETQFIVLRDEQTLTELTADVTTYIDENASCDIAYNYQIMAQNDVGNSLPSNTADITIACPEEPVMTDETTEPSPEQIPENPTEPNPEQTTENNVTEQTEESISITELPAELLPPPPVVEIKDNSTLTRTANIGGATVRNITIQQGGSLSNGTLDGEIINHGFVSNIIIKLNTTIKGGSVSGVNINFGIMRDVIITTYSEVRGGYFAGQIINNGILIDVIFLDDGIIIGGKLGGIIQSGGIIRDIRILPYARIIGGRMGGNIRGTKLKPAYLGNVILLDGTQIQYVRISPTTQLPDNIQIGEGVIFPKSYKNPDLEDFGVDEASLETIDAYEFNGIEPAAFELFEPEHIDQLPLEIFAEFEAEDVEHLQPEAVEAIEVEQFELLPEEALEGLTADNVDALSDEVLEQAITPEKLDAIKPEAIKKSKKPGKIFTRLKKIKPKQIRRYLPDGWTIKDDTGELSAPAGTKLTHRTIKQPVSRQKASLPEVTDLDSSFSLGGTGGKTAEENLNEGMQQTPDVGDVELDQFIFTQNDNTGMLNIVGEGDYEGITFAFLPDVNDIEQAPLDIPVGLSQDEGGFFIMTTPNQQSFFLTPSTNDPAGLVEVLTDEEVTEIEEEEIETRSQGCGFSDQVVKFNESGDALLTLTEESTRRIRAFETEIHVIVIFDAFVEPAPDLYCDDEVCDWPIMPTELQKGMHLPDKLRARQQAKVIYPDGTAQIIYPTVLKPTTFIELMSEFEGMENLIYQADGSFKADYFGQSITIYSTFDTTLKPLSSLEIEIQPEVILQDDGQFLYSVQDCSRLVTTSLVIE